MTPSAGKPQGKKNYVSPKLETYGSVEELTGQKTNTGIRQAHLGHNGDNTSRPFAS